MSEKTTTTNHADLKVFAPFLQIINDGPGKTLTQKDSSLAQR